MSQNGEVDDKRFNSFTSQLGPDRRLPPCARSPSGRPCSVGRSIPSRLTWRSNGPVDLRSSRRPLKAEIAGSNPAWVTRDRVVELADTRRSERRAVRHGSSTLPLVTSGWLASRLGLISPVPPGSNPGLATSHGRVRKLAKRPGREPGVCGFDSRSDYLKESTT